MDQPDLLPRTAGARLRGGDLDRLDAAGLRAAGSLKWTGTRAAVAAWVAESDLGTAPEVTRALHDAVSSGLLGYLPPAVHRDLRAACAAWQEERYGWLVDPEHVHVVPDIVEALRLTVEHLTRPGSAVVVPTPAYMPFVTIPRRWGREVVQTPLVPAADGRPGLDLGAIDAALRAGAGLVVLVNPHNPTGRVLSVDELTALAAVVEAHGARVFADEVHAPIVHTGHRHVPYASVSAAAAAHAVTATSASKGWNVAGLKCAQVILSAEADRSAWRRVDERVTDMAAPLGVLANTAAYREGGPWLDEAVAYLGANAHAFADALAAGPADLSLAPVEGTYLAWVDVRRALATADVAPGTDVGRWVEERSGVAVTDGARCGRAGEGFVRVNLALPRRLAVEAGHRLGEGLAPA